MIIKWTYRHHSLTADTYDSLDDAVRAAFRTSGHGDEALESIEVIGSDGESTLYEGSALYELIRPLEIAEDQKTEKQPKPSLVVEVKSLNGKWASYNWFSEEAAAEREASWLRQSIGSRRVRIRQFVPS